MSASTTHACLIPFVSGVAAPCPCWGNPGTNSTLSAQSATGTPGPDDVFLDEVAGDLTLPPQRRPRRLHRHASDRTTVLAPGGGELRYMDIPFTPSEEVTIPSGGTATVEVSSPTPAFDRSSL